MPQIASAVNTAFTPAVGDFIVQCTGGVVGLQRRGAAAAEWTDVGTITSNDSPIVSNPVAGADYRFVPIVGTPVVRADQ
jgi:hypothetical protein